MSGKNKMLYEKRGRIGVITLNRPDVLNAMDLDVWHRLPEIAAEIDADWDVRCVVLTGAGEKAFSAGLDLKSAGALLGNAMQGASAARKAAVAQLELRALQNCFSSLYEIRVPVIAAVNGYCLGAGTELICACDIRFAGKNAQFSVEEVALGIVPDMGSTQRLPRIIGMGKAKQILLTGIRINAEEAHRIGLVEEVFEPKDTLAKAVETAETIAKKGPLAVQATKRAINMSASTALDVGLRYETVLAASNLIADDIPRGVIGRLKKEDPDFKAE